MPVCGKENNAQMRIYQQSLLVEDLYQRIIDGGREAVVDICPNYLQATCKAVISLELMSYLQAAWLMSRKQICAMNTRHT